MIKTRTTMNMMETTRMKKTKLNTKSFMIKNKLKTRLPNSVRMDLMTLESREISFMSRIQEA